MKYYSETLRKMFDSEESLHFAEKEYDEKEAAAKKEREEYAANRKAAAAEVEEKYKIAAAAHKDYRKALNEFSSKYGSYYTTIHSKDLENFEWSHWLDDLFTLF